MARIGRWGHLYTFVAQVVLAALMVGVSLVASGGAQVSIILALAGVAAVLAVVFPMRVLEEKGTSRIVIMVFLLLLAILILLTALDVGTRHIMERPPLSG